MGLCEGGGHIGARGGSGQTVYGDYMKSFLFIPFAERKCTFFQLYPIYPEFPCLNNNSEVKGSSSIQSKPYTCVLCRNEKMEVGLPCTENYRSKLVIFVKTKSCFKTFCGLYFSNCNPKDLDFLS